MKIKVVMHHTHVFPKGYRDYGSPDDLAKYMEEHEIYAAILFPPIPPLDEKMKKLIPDGNQNKWVAKLAEEYDGFIAWATVDTSRGDLAEQLEEAYSYGCKGVKLHPHSQNFRPDEEKMYPLYEKAAELGMPILFHSGYHKPKPYLSHPAHIDAVAEKFSKLKIILEHMGFPFYTEALAVVAHRSNVYGGITQILRLDKVFKVKKIEYPGGVRNEVKGYPGSLVPAQCLCMKTDDFVDAVKWLGARKFIWGSDWPYNKRPDVFIELILSLPLSIEEKELILGGNALRIME